MGERITVVGGTDSTIAVTLDGTQALKLAKQFSQELQNYYSVDQLNFLDVTADGAAPVEHKIGYGVITQGGAAYSAGNGYDYIVVGGKNAQSPKMGMTATEINNLSLLNGPVTINSVMNSSQFVRVLSGNIQSFTYNAGQESGQLAAGAENSNVVFNGNTVNGGNWDIAVGTGNNTIVAGSGNNNISIGNQALTGQGQSSIDLTAGKINNVTSYGQDTITASNDSTAQNRVSLFGGLSEDIHSTVNLNEGAAVNDFSFYNVVTVGGGSTIQGGTYGNYTFNGSNDSNAGQLNGGQSSSITATGDLQVVQGDSNTINASRSLSFFNGVGNTEATAQGQFVGFGAGGLNYTLNASGNDSGLFVADVGNETLNASGSTSALQIYANTVVGGSSDFVASGGSGNDTLVAGTGNATFSGGAGDNLFMFNKAITDNGNTVITDFSKNGNGDKIGLYNYGLDNDSIANLLKTSENDAKGNAVLKLDGHTITIEGVSVSDLTVNQFDVANPNGVVKS
ncbi:calcium-binding protein [Commensalibacter papalotli (ex Botero et al. 2024)]|uniref:RTX toxin-related (PDB:1AF0) (PUBMED:15135544) n=1 Tax=Commensalibacter papalotli (ex Botero et al. 2024) TaxID=2972766 RepID=A0ABM9HSU5_9PROT|nr:calcium-binding protein [Commensalibacter papalotli (ex Botero et al. 2024)]CAI3952642.1 Ca2+-binding protein [Commensalibacter papalotli (ex Botero et al. 2024)]CAI3953171.1 Ca2+-binding protein [Commensalibacter papalotli (ex Botero et al. 2024)]